MKIPDTLKDTTVLVIGDVMLDRYWWGEVTRISPEAPVPVVRLQRSSVAAGGAANVAANIAGLGATPLLIGCVGNDAEADVFETIFQGSRISAEHLVRVRDRPTTVKTRVIAHSQQVTRVDQEISAPLDETGENAVLERVLGLFEKVQAIAVSDYAKGVLTERVLLRVIAEAGAKGIPVLVDPKGKHYTKYAGATVITPNRREAAEACNLADDSQFCIETAGVRLIEQSSVDAVLITQGEDGMTLFRKDQAPVHLRALAREVYDVTGAGDTVLATLAAAVGAGSGLEDAARLANAAAGIVVEQVGTTAITADELAKAIES